MGETSAFSTTLRQAQAGDPVAAQALHRQYVEPLVRSIRRRLHQPLRRRFDTADVAQSIFAEVLRDLPRLQDRGEAAFRAWVKLKLRSNLGMKLRKHLGPRGERVEGVGPSPDALESRHLDPASAADRSDQDDALRGLLAQLSGEQRQLVAMRLQEELPFAEIAERLSLSSPDAARKRYMRALGRLRSAGRESPLPPEHRA